MGGIYGGLGKGDARLEATVIDHFKGDKKEKTWYTVSALLPFCMVFQLRNPMSSFVLVIKKKSKQATSLPYLV